MTESTVAAQPTQPVSIQVDCLPFVNFAMQQNAVPLLRALTASNTSDKQIADLRLRLWTDPAVTAEKTLRVDEIGPGTSYAFLDLALTLLREPLRKQAEREEGHLWIESTADGIPGYRQPFPLSVLAYNEWCGISTLREIIAAHVLPNDPAVERILAEASKLLLEKTQDGSLSGYQSGNPSRAYAQAAAIYVATARQKINYVSPPASFEVTGQKIRTPEHLLDRKLGTCMDTSVLLAACFEQAGLRPVVILVKEHAFLGVWLVDKSFDDPVVAHASLLLNRIGLNHLLVVESTGVTKTPPLSFKAATELAKTHLDNEANFHFAVDVKAARKSGIRPLSLTESVAGSTDSIFGPELNTASNCEDIAAPELTAVVNASDSTTGSPRAAESAADRLARWKTSLLDLSLRSRLLNFKDSKKAIPLLCPSIASLEDALANEEAFRVRPKAESWGEADPRDAVLHREQTGEDGLGDYLREEMAQRRLHAAVTERELAVRLTQIERDARLGLEEGGANTLFLALGFLVWTEAETSDVEYRAPILLIPVSIERKSVSDGFRIKRIDEESRINITLLQKLKVDFGISVDGLDPLPEDDSGLDVPKILRTIRDAIKRKPRWKVVEDAWLSVLTFSRFLMWLDLEANAEALKQNALVRHLVETPNELFDPNGMFPDPEMLDDAYAPSGTFCPLHADSSQLRAVFAATEGRTFVLQGPPGTGKSQTIANLIAQCLTDGRRILFVAQKRAALDVVHRRLADVGLGPFCLELHSNKTTKESFRAQLRQALSVAASGTSERWAAETSRLAELRRSLNQYVRDLHQPRAFGKSAYWAISRLIGHEDERRVALDLDETTGRSSEDYGRMQAAVREMAEAARVSGDPGGHPLSAVRLTTWSYGVEDDAQKAIRATEDAIGLLRQVAATVMPEIGTKTDGLSLTDLAAAQQRCEALAADSERLMRLFDQLQEMLPTVCLRPEGDDATSRLNPVDNNWSDFQDGIGRRLEGVRQRRAEVLSRAQRIQTIHDGLALERYPAFRASQWESYGWDARAIADLRDLLSLLLTLLNQAATELQRAESTYESWRKLLSEAPFLPSGLLSTADWVGLKGRLGDAIRRGKTRDERRQALLNDYSPAFFDLDVDRLLDTLRTKDQHWFLRRWRMGRSVRKLVKRVRLGKPGKLDFVGISKDLESAAFVLRESLRLAKEDQEATQFFQAKWNAGEADWRQLENAIGWSEQFCRALGTPPESDQALQQTIADASRRASDAAKEPNSRKSELGGPFARYSKCYEALSEARTRLEHVLQLSEPWGEETEAGVFERTKLILCNLSSNLKLLRGWSHYQSARAVVVGLGLSALVDDLERGNVPTSEVESLFEHSFADWWARSVLRSIPSLAGFIGDRHELKIREFREYEARIADLTRQETFARIASGLPRGALAGQRTPASSEVGLLQRFAQGGRKTIRRVFKECPNALAKYKPCVLMSPLSVAQFIGADFPKFDLVVFDEASQMPTYEAVGAIARGNQLIVVGDSKQLPPTTFFERQKGDEEFSEDDLPEELESILEEVGAAGVKPLRLDWHYRSRHESLIAFSNYEYYENRLLTFPAALAKHPRLGVHWREVPGGVYDQGKSRANRKEAEAVVAEIVRRLRDTQERTNSLGVVTFSMSQQRLVEDLLDAARGEYPEIEPYFTTVGEPVFVKNLETVQGDERDVILFSICYGPDAAGVIRMNFGPLNNRGGERRLNVAITRARKQLLVFSTLRPEQIDVSRTQAVGVQHLRTFLDYARRGQAALTAETSRTTGEVESPFEQSVVEELTRRGWGVDVQVGCSGYRIDLAVRDPQVPGRYLLGVECDGANYHSAKSARDRDAIRQKVLEGLGWRLHRIWSTEWWHQRQKEIAKVEEALRLAQEAAGANSDVDLGPATNVPTTDESSVESGGGEDQNSRYAKVVAPPEAQPTEPAPAVTQLPGQSIHRRCEPGASEFSGELHDPANASKVGELVKMIVGMEAPVSFDTLCSEVASCWGLQRAGSRIRDAVSEAVKRNDLPVRRTGKRDFIWTKELTGKPYVGFRVPSEDDPRPRQAQEICPEEVANAAAEVLAVHISMGVEDLARETANVFGIRRLGANVRSSIDEGIELLKKNCGCRVEGETLVAL